MIGPENLSFEYPRNVRFKCGRCAICCGDTETKVRKILLMKTEAERISNKTMKPICEFAERRTGSEPYVYEMRKNKDGKCVFLRENTCLIYRIRPLICTFYPFELGANRANRHIFSYTDECPCIGHGAELGKDYFEKLFANSKQLTRRVTM
jgi:Fe-S-cluster containining protein